jgi:hypothetical protein
MWRHQAICNHCARATPWQRDRRAGAEEMQAHLKGAHGLADPEEPLDYQISRQRQCDYCLGPYLDYCTKCTRDFCQLHAGDIDGLCGGCI